MTNQERELACAKSPRARFHYARCVLARNMALAAYPSEPDPLWLKHLGSRRENVRLRAWARFDRISLRHYRLFVKSAVADGAVSPSWDIDSI